MDGCFQILKLSIREENIMAMVVKNNMSAVRTLNTLNTNQTNLTKSLAKVSSGMKINSAADDASGYAISERMRVQIRSLDQANQNTQNGSSMMKTAEGAVSSTVEILKTLKEKVINAANDTNTDSDRQTIQKELNQSIDQIDDNANVTFNGKYLVDGSKMNKGEATYTSMTNQSLSTDTTADTKLTDLKSRAGQDLNISTTDSVTVSYVQQGRTYSTTFDVTSDTTMQSIFNAAENIDTTSQTFATFSNDSVQAALGKDAKTATSTDVEAVNKAIDKLRGELANGTSSTDIYQLKDDTTGNKAVTNNNVNPQGGSVITADYTVLNNQEQWSLETTGFYSQDTSSKDEITPTDGVATDEAKGETYKALDASLKARNGAASKVGSYDATNSNNSSGLAGVLGKKLHEAGVTWSGQKGDIEAAMNQARALDKAQTTIDSIESSYQDYVNASADLDAANKDLQTKLDDYNDKVQQLDALVKQKGLNDYKASYDKSVENYLDEVKTAATEATNSISYTDKDGVTQTWSKGASGKEEFINNMVDDLRAQLNGLESSASVQAVAGSVKVNGSTPKDNDSQPLNGTTNNTSIKKAADTAKNIADQRKHMAGASGQWSYDMADKLSKALNGIVNDMKGPQLLTGSDIGTNANGDMVSTASGQNGISFTAANSGSRGQIAGFTVAVRDSEGNLKKSVNASLDAFEETVRGVDASEDNAINLQVGAKANQAITVGLTDMRSEALGLKGSDGTKLNISTREKANAAVNVLDNALAKALDQQTTIGSIESRLEYTSSNLTTASENVQASESTIRDADMAKEMTNYTKNNVLLQAAQSMLAQANQNSSAVLSLLQ